MAARPIRQGRPGWAHWSTRPACTTATPKARWHWPWPTALSPGNPRAPAANAQKVAAEAFQMVTQKIVEAQALDTLAADYLRTITAQIDVQMDLLRRPRR